MVADVEVKSVYIHLHTSFTKYIRFIGKNIQIKSVYVNLIHTSFTKYIKFMKTNIQLKVCMCIYILLIQNILYSGKPMFKLKVCM